MTETEFNQAVDALMLAIDNALDASGADMDFESAGGVLTITCENNGSQIVISRQPALAQIWVAARSGGFHLENRGAQWICTTTGETLGELLNRVCSEQTGEPVSLDF